jgi:NAD(P)-dependent dehydrogenase (short-subunit alcohol dehydrogenase family)
MKTFNGKTAVITGAASGFGLEFSRVCAREGMNVVMADVQQDALDLAADEITRLGAAVLPLRVDVAKAAEVEALGAAAQARFGAPNLVFNNAGVAMGGLAWEYSVQDWEWLIGINLMGVAHGIRVFTPMMLEAAKQDASYEGHIVSSASMAGLISLPMSAVYNVTKHGVVTLSETLFHDLALVTDRIHCSVLCPYFVPTRIFESDRNRPPAVSNTTAPTPSQLAAKAITDRAVHAGKVSAVQVAQQVMDAVANRQFYIFSHPEALHEVQTRLEDVLQQRNPSDAFKDRRSIGEKLRQLLGGKG